MDLEQIMFLREVEHFERGLSALEVAVCELKYQIYRLKHPQHVYENMIAEMEKREVSNESW